MDSRLFCHVPQTAPFLNGSLRSTSQNENTDLPAQLSMNGLWGNTYGLESYFCYPKIPKKDTLSHEEFLTNCSTPPIEETYLHFSNFTGHSTTEKDSYYLFYENGKNENVTPISLFNTLMRSLELHGTNTTALSTSQAVPRADCLKSLACPIVYESSNLWEEGFSTGSFKVDSFVPELSTCSTVFNSMLHPTKTPFVSHFPQTSNVSQGFDSTEFVEFSKDPFQCNESSSYLLEYCKRYHEAKLLQKTCFSFEDSLFLDFVLLMLYKENRRPSKQRIQNCINVFHGSTFLQNNYLKYYQIMSSKYRISSFESNNVYIYFKKNPSWFEGWSEAEISTCPLSITFLIEFHDYLTQLLRWNQMKKMKAIFLTKKNFATNPGQNVSVIEKEKTMPNRKKESSCPFKVTFKNIYFLAKQIKDISSVFFHSYNISQLCQIIELAANTGLLVSEDSSIIPKASSVSVTLKFVELDPETYASEADLFSKPPLSISNNLPTISLELKSQLEQSIKNVEELVREKKFKPLLLSQFKTKYFQKYHQELDTLVFGYPRLSDFIKQYCSQFCRFIHTENRQVFVDRVRNQGKDCSQTGYTVFKKEAEIVHKAGTTTGTTLDENESLTVSEALLSLLSKHRRFHNNISFSFWQYCTFCNTSRDQDVSLLCGAAATFTDLLFASILKPTSTKPFLTSSHEMSSTDVSSLRWFTREPLIQRRLRLNTLASTTHALQDFMFNVLPPKLSETCETEVFKLPRPSRLRRYVTSQMAQLNQSIFNAVPNIVIY